MKTACIGDIHGVSRWKESLNLSVDKYIFLGDYVDSFDIPDKDIFNNLTEIIDFKLSNPNNVILLLGNHDIQYLYYPNYMCTGFRLSMQDSLSTLFQKHIGQFQVAWCNREFVFTHAGLSRMWMKDHFQDNLTNQRIVENLNTMLSEKSGRDKLAYVGRSRGGLNDHVGPFWCDFNYELVVDPYSGINQIVGHTRTNYLMRDHSSGNELINVDYLAYSTEPILVLDEKEQ